MTPDYGRNTQRRRGDKPEDGKIFRKYSKAVIQVWADTVDSEFSELLLYSTIVVISM